MTHSATTKTSARRRRKIHNSSLGPGSAPANTVDAADVIPSEARPESLTEVRELLQERKTDEAMKLLDELTGANVMPLPNFEVIEEEAHAEF